MPVSMDFDLDDYVSAGDLDSGDYTFEIKDCKETEYDSLQVKVEVLDGPPDKNGKPVEGRIENFFITTGGDNMAAHEFLKDIMKDFYVACGQSGSAEAEDFIGATFKSRVSTSVNSTTGKVYNNIGRPIKAA